MNPDAFGSDETRKSENQEGSADDFPGFLIWLLGSLGGRQGATEEVRSTSFFRSTLNRMRTAMTLLLLGFAGCCLSVGIETGGGKTAGTAAGTGGSGTSGGTVGGGSSGGTAGVCSGVAPTNHRSSDAQCQTTAAPGNGGCPDFCGPGTLFSCNGDAQCDAGLEGRCVEYCCIANSTCTYDQCTFDSDCPANQTCACHGSPYLAPSDNTCVPGNCRVDADCESGCDCSPSESCFSCLAYYCHTPNDLCVNDSDCQAQDLGVPSCAYSTDAGHWECTSFPVPG
jgi:hypothetical protein